MKALGYVIALSFSGATVAVLGRGDPPAESLLAPVLVSPSVETYGPDDVGLNLFGSFYAFAESSIPGKNTVFANESRSEMHFLGCRFVMQPKHNDPVLELASQALSKVSGHTPTSAYGYLIAPKRVGIEDPVINVACDHSRQYYYFTFRNRVGLFDNYGHSTIVLEYQLGGPNPFDQPYSWMKSDISNSKRALMITQDIEQMYVIPYIEPENEVLAEKEKQDVLDFLINAVPMVLAL